MDWSKHKELYSTPNMSKLLLIALEKWKDYEYVPNKSCGNKQSKLKLIDCEDL